MNGFSNLDYIGRLKVLIHDNRDVLFNFISIHDKIYKIYR